LFTSARPSPHRQLTLKQRARAMRLNPTESEAVLWRFLKSKQLGVAFRRQVPVCGAYIADFLASSVRLIVEVDGGYHAERGQLDAVRDQRLDRAGYRVLRLPGALVLEQPLAALRLVVEALAVAE
jgi:very-short-patch-repair endonuclease